MTCYRISSIFWSILFVAGAVFIWFRKTDGAGVKNSPLMQYISLGLWVGVFLVVLIAHLIWRYSLKKRA